jgi:Ni/Fe-hydrogenase b-type cytochrome subunit
MRQGLQRSDLVLRAEQDQPPFVGKIQGGEAQEFADPGHFGAEGEADEQFVFGDIRFAHFAAGWVLTVGALGRIYWAFFDNHPARQMFFVPFKSASFWFEIRWYLFLVKEPKTYVGQDPLAQLSMVFFITLGGPLQVRDRHGTLC